MLETVAKLPPQESQFLTLHHYQGKSHKNEVVLLNRATGLRATSEHPPTRIGQFRSPHLHIIQQRKNNQMGHETSFVFFPVLGIDGTQG